MKEHSIWTQTWLRILLSPLCHCCVTDKLKLFNFFQALAFFTGNTEKKTYYFELFWGLNEVTNVQPPAKIVDTTIS